MKRQNLLSICGAAIGMLVLIFDGKTAISGAIDGIELSLYVLIPSLFPFFLLTMLLTGALSGQALPRFMPLARDIYQNLWDSKLGVSCNEHFCKDWEKKSSLEC